MLSTIITLLLLMFWVSCIRLGIVGDIGKECTLGRRVFLYLVGPFCFIVLGCLLPKAKLLEMIERKALSHKEVEDLNK